MNKYKVSIKTGREGFNGYDHYDVLEYIVDARNSKSAENKAKKLAIPKGRLSQSLWTISITTELLNG